MKGVGVPGPLKRGFLRESLLLAHLGPHSSDKMTSFKVQSPFYGQSGGAVGEQHYRQSGGFLTLEEALKVVRRFCAPLRSAVS